MKTLDIEEPTALLIGLRKLRAWTTDVSKVDVEDGRDIRRFLFDAKNARPDFEQFASIEDLLMELERALINKEGFYDQQVHRQRLTHKIDELLARISTPSEADPDHATPRAADSYL